MFMNIVATATATFPKSLTREELRGGPTASILLLLPLLLLLLLLLFFFFFFFFLLFHSPFLLDAILCRDSFISPLPTSSLLNLLARILFRILFRIRIRQSLRSFEFVNFYRLFWVFFSVRGRTGEGGCFESMKDHLLPESQDSQDSCRILDSSLWLAKTLGFLEDSRRIPPSLSKL